MGELRSACQARYRAVLGRLPGSPERNREVNAYVVQTNMDTPGQAIEVHLVEDDAKRRVRELNRASSETYWYKPVPMKHRLLIGTELGKATVAAVTPLAAIGAMGG